MKKIVLIIVLFTLQSGLLTAQHSREKKLLQLKNRCDIKVTEIEKDILMLEYPNGKVLIKNVGDFERQTTKNPHPTTYSPTYDSTIIDLTIPEVSTDAIYDITRNTATGKKCQ